MDIKKDVLEDYEKSNDYILNCIDQVSHCLGEKTISSFTDNRLLKAMSYIINHYIKFQSTSMNIHDKQVLLFQLLWMSSQLSCSHHPLNYYEDPLVKQKNIKLLVDKYQIVKNNNNCIGCNFFMDLEFLKKLIPIEGGSDVDQMNRLKPELNSYNKLKHIDKLNGNELKLVWNEITSHLKTIIELELSVKDETSKNTEREKLSDVSNYPNIYFIVGWRREVQRGEDAVKKLDTAIEMIDSSIENSYKKARENHDVLLKNRDALAKKRCTVNEFCLDVSENLEAAKTIILAASKNREAIVKMFHHDARIEKLDTAIKNLEDVVKCLETSIDNPNSVIENLDAAVNNYDTAIYNYDDAIMLLYSEHFIQNLLFVVFRALTVVGEFSSSKILTLKTRKENSELHNKLKEIKKLADKIVKPQDYYGNFCEENDLFLNFDFEYIKKRLSDLKESLNSALPNNQVFKCPSEEELNKFIAENNKLFKEEMGSGNVEEFKVLGNLLTKTKQSSVVYAEDILQRMHVLLREACDNDLPSPDILNKKHVFYSKIEFSSSNLLEIYYGVYYDTESQKVKYEKDPIELRIPKEYAERVKEAKNAIIKYNGNKRETKCFLLFFSLKKEEIQKRWLHSIVDFIEFGKYCKLHTFFRQPDKRLLLEFYLQSAYYIVHEKFNFPGEEEYKVLRNFLRHYDDNYDIKEKPRNPSMKFYCVSYALRYVTEIKPTIKEIHNYLNDERKSTLETLETEISQTIKKQTGKLTKSKYKKYVIFEKSAIQLPNSSAYNSLAHGMICLYHENVDFKNFMKDNKQNHFFEKLIDIISISSKKNQQTQWIRYLEKHPAILRNRFNSTSCDIETVVNELFEGCDSFSTRSGCSRCTNSENSKFINLEIKNSLDWNDIQTVVEDKKHEKTCKVNLKDLLFIRTTSLENAKNTTYCFIHQMIKVQISEQNYRNYYLNFLIHHDSSSDNFICFCRKSNEYVWILDDIDNSSSYKHNIHVTPVLLVYSEFKGQVEYEVRTQKKQAKKKDGNVSQDVDL